MSFISNDGDSVNNAIATFSLSFLVFTLTKFFPTSLFCGLEMLQDQTEFGLHSVHFVHYKELLIFIKKSKKSRNHEDDHQEKLI